MDDTAFLFQLGIALIAAFAGGLVAQQLKLPVIIGYLVAGVAVGPYTPGVTAQQETVHAVAELGVCFLMFAVGVHFSLPDLMKMWRTAVIGGGLQLLGTIVLGVFLGIAFGWTIYGALFLGCAIALSSTAVMLKVLEERGEQGTAPGRVMLGILITQDLSLVLMIILLPAIGLIASQGWGAMDDVFKALLKAAAFILGALFLSAKVVPSMMKLVARTGSRELFLIFAVCLCLAVSAAADVAGLGLELGAFLAGLIISETDYSHEVFTQVRPLRDVFASLFFVSVGMLFNPGFMAQNFGIVMAVVVAIVLGKSLVSFLAVYSQHWHGRTAVVAGLGLAQIGEFSFVLAQLGGSQGLIKNYIADVILSAALITLLLAPFLYQASGPLYQWLCRYPRIAQFLNRSQDQLDITSPTEAAASQVAILGYGQVGRYVSAALRRNNIHHLLLDYDLRAFDQLDQSGVSVLYGDASSETVLEPLKEIDPELVIVLMPDADVAEMAVRLLREILPNATVVVRVHRGRDIQRLREAGANDVIHAEFEASTELIRQSLRQLGVSEAVTREYCEDIRRERYHLPA